MALLIVEDEEAIRELIADCLTDVGYQVLQAQDAQQAKWLLYENASMIELVLTDFRMPGENGVSLAKHVHRTYPDIPVLLASGNVTHEEIDGERFIMKPFTLNRLLSEIQLILRGR